MFFSGSHVLTNSIGVRSLESRSANRVVSLSTGLVYADSQNVNSSSSDAFTAVLIISLASLLKIKLIKKKVLNYYGQYVLPFRMFAIKFHLICNGTMEIDYLLTVCCQW